MRIKSLVLKFTGFSIVGIIVNIVGLLSTYLFLGILKTPLYTTYAFIYFFSIIISYLLNSKFVFKIKSTIKRTIIYFLIYLSSMLIGLLLLKFYNKVLPLENWILAYLTMPITLFWNFILSNLLLKKI